LLIEQWDLDTIHADLMRCGLTGSPTKVHRVQAIVLTKEASPTYTPRRPASGKWYTNWSLIERGDSQRGFRVRVQGSGFCKRTVPGRKRILISELACLSLALNPEP